MHTEGIMQYKNKSKVDIDCIAQRYSSGVRARWSRVRVSIEVKNFSPPRPGRLWVPPSLLSKGYWGRFSWE